MRSASAVRRSSTAGTIVISFQPDNKIVRQPPAVKPGATVTPAKAGVQFSNPSPPGPLSLRERGWGMRAEFGQPGRVVGQDPVGAAGPKRGGLGGVVHRPYMDRAAEGVGVGNETAGGDGDDVVSFGDREGVVRRPFAAAARWRSRQRRRRMSFRLAPTRKRPSRKQASASWCSEATTHRASAPCRTMTSRTRSCPSTSLSSMRTGNAREGVEHLVERRDGDAPVPEGIGGAVVGSEAEAGVGALQFGEGA